MYWYHLWAALTHQDGNGAVREGDLGQSDAGSPWWGLAIVRAAWSAEYRTVIYLLIVIISLRLLII